MKILMVLESEFPPDVRVENEMLALTDSGHEVHLACSAKKNRPEKEILGKAVIHRERMSTFIYKSSVGCLKFPFYFNFWRRFIFKLAAREKYDAIHIHDLPLSLIGTEIKSRFNIPLVIDLHENWPALIKNAAHTQTLLGKILSSHRQWIEYEQNVLPQADRIITVVEEAKERIIKLGINPEKITIVSNTVNFENISIATTGKETQEFTIFYGGAINIHRGLQIVLNAVKLLADKKINIHFIIVGDGSYRKELEIETDTLGIRSLVHFYGYKPFNEMLEILAGADAAIIPHLRTDNNDASSPNKLYQYMYLNKPVISSDCISLKRIINETRTGFIYNNELPEDLASLIEKLRSDKNTLESAGSNGRKAVMEKYNWTFDKKRLTGLYDQLNNMNTLH